MNAPGRTRKRKKEESENQRSKNDWAKEKQLIFIYNLTALDYQPYSYYIHPKLSLAHWNMNKIYNFRHAK